MRVFKTLLLLSAMLHGAAAFAEPAILAVHEAGNCRLALEAERSSNVLRVRTAEHCAVPVKELAALINGGLPKALPQGAAAPHMSIFIGRLVAYPALARSLARSASASGSWDAGQGKAASGNVNTLVGRLLGKQAELAPVRQALRRHGWRLTRISVEKVLVGRHRDAPAHIEPGLKGKLPFDAQTWLVVKRVSPSSRS